MSFQFFILAVVFAVAAANSYKSAATYEEVTYVSDFRQMIDDTK